MTKLLSLAELSTKQRAVLELRLKDMRAGMTQPQITRQKRETDALPLSFAQQRLWFIDQLLPGSAIYVLPFPVRLKGRLNAEATRRALNEIVRRHEILRTTFVMLKGEPAQVVAPALTIPLPLVDLCEMAEAEREAECARLAVDEAERPFDLSKGPLMRVTLVRVSEEDHLLLLTLHHIVTDGWSNYLLVRELATLYEAYSKGMPSPLAELPIQYADYAVWQREWLQGEVLEEQLQYWRKQLAGAPQVLELPTDRPRPAVESHRGALKQFQLKPELTRKLKELSQREDVTLFMLLLAAWQVLLARYSGQDDVVVGTPIANRMRAEVEGLIGFFVNTLALRVEVRGGESFRELLRRVRESCLGAYGHQDVPFEKLVEELQPERSLSYSPFFQVMFILQNTESGTLDLSGLSMLSQKIDTSVSTIFDLAISIKDKNGVLDGLAQFNTDLFDRTTIERMMGHYEKLLEEIATDPQQYVSDLSLLSESERHQLLVEWNDTQRDYPEGQCIHELFEEQARLRAEAEAIVCGEQRPSYRELNERANQLAHYLRKEGVGPEKLVGILMERSVEMVVGLLAVLKAGGAYLPVDPRYPVGRLSYMLRDGGAAVVLTQERLRELLPESRARVLSVDGEGEQVGSESGANPESGVEAENLAYVIYTSGSTGEPKGAAIRHGSAVSMIRWSLETYSEVEREGMLASTSICFDLSVFELFVALSGGTKIIMAQDALELPALGARDEVTLVNTVPSAMSELVRSGALPGKVQVVNLAGEALRQELVDQVYGQTGVRRVMNLYGPSEDTTYSTWGEMKAGERPTIGVPLAEKQAYVLDQNLRLVPVGASGELYLGGEGLARGYVGRAGLTAERFVPDPFGGEAGARLYRTGDVVRWLPDGRLEFLGRRDAQVKVRGHRIELGEIEAVLCEHARVGQAVVAAHEETDGGRRLIAYVVVQGEGTWGGMAELRRYLQGRLPGYMMPSAFMELEKLPLTPNGKIDRRALPDPGNVRPESEATYVKPRTELESSLALIWKELLQVERVGIHDNFFDLGGHSLLILQMQNRLQGSFKSDLSITELFKYPSISSLARFLTRGEAGPVSPDSLIETRKQGKHRLKQRLEQSRRAKIVEPGESL